MDNLRDDFFGEPISVYTAAQALDDGVLVTVRGEGGVNRVTRAVFDHFAKHTGDPALGEFDLSLLLAAITAILAVVPEDGWLTQLNNVAHVGAIAGLAFTKDGRLYLARQDAAGGDVVEVDPSNGQYSEEWPLYPTPRVSQRTPSAATFTCDWQERGALRHDAVGRDFITWHRI